MRGCKRCKGEVSWTADTVILMGGVKAHLCNDCRTDFHAYVTQLPEWGEKLVLEARGHYFEGLAKGGRPKTEEDYLAVLQAGDALERRFFVLGLAWVETPKPVAVGIPSA
jgi:hypothetical protein